MIFKFLILSDEANDFKREIKIDADATFMDLYNTLIESIGYSEKEMASFFLSDDKWRKKQEITLVEMDTDSDVDSLVMEDCILSDFLEDEKQKLLFVFEYLTQRALYIELSEIIPGKYLKKPFCSISYGEAPAQIITQDEVKPDVVTIDLGESFYGDERFDLEELDIEGFEGLDNVEDTSSETDSFDIL
jgi:hypothetical protein